MKGKKLLLVMIIAMVITAGWLVTVKAVTGSEEIKKQKELTADADVYMEKELYVRAIPLYKEALTFSTDLNPAIQEKLLDAYLRYGDTDAYIRLVENRISSGMAKEEEYVNAADHYIASYKVEEAMVLIRRGIDKLHSETLESYYEEHRYRYSLSGTKYVDIVPTASNSLMPAYNGMNWGYINDKGRTVLDFIYDSATPFNSYGYAVVSINETYYTILQNGDWYGVDDGSQYPKMTNVSCVSGSRVLGEREGSCSYFNYDFEPIAQGHQYSGMTANACGLAAVKKGEKWGIITDSGKTAVDFVLEDVAVNSLGCAFAGDRAMVKENGLWHLIDTEGNRIGTGEYTDARAPESEGYIAVCDREGKWGYINHEGEDVIECQYDDARSFSDGLGAVQIADDWNYISEKNEIVIEEPFTSAAPFHNGIAQAGLGEGKVLITLQYVEK